MQAERAHTLIEVLCEVLEKYAFMFGEENAKNELPRTSSDFVQSEITFSGPKQGLISITVPAEICPEITSNVLGMEPESDHELWGMDAVNELLNVACGRILVALFGDEVIFDISAPQGKKIGETLWNENLNDPNTLGLLIDNSPVLVHFHIDNEEEVN